MRYFAAFTLVVLLGASLSAQEYRWERLKFSLIQPRHLHGAVHMRDGWVLVVGGYVNSSGPLSGKVTNNCEQIVLPLNMVQSGSSWELNEARAEMQVLKRSDGMIYAIGGWGGNGVLTSIERFDGNTPPSSRWEVVGDMKVGRRQLTACFMDDDRILIIGGRNDNLDCLRECEVFDTRTNTTRQVADFPFPVSSAMAYLGADGKVHCIGGRDGGPNSFRDSVEYIFDGTRWSKGRSLGERICAPQILTLHTGETLITGGSLREEPLECTESVWLSGDATLQKLDTRMSNGRQWHGIAQLNEELAITGGGGGPSGTYLKSCDWYDVSARSMRQGPALNDARAWYTMVAVPVGVAGSGPTVIAIGGAYEEDNVSSIEMLVEGCDGGTLTDVQTSPYSVAVGSAVIGDRVAMMTDTTQYSASAIWTKSKIAVADGFSTTFRFRLSDGDDRGQIDGSDPGADGVALVIQNTSDRPLGKPGEGIGYEDIANSVAIEFDSYLNAHYNDPNGSHVAVQSNGKGLNKPWHQPPYQRALQVLPQSLRENVSYYVKVEYTPGALQVYFAAGPVNATTSPDFGAPVVSLSSFDLTSVLDLESDGSAWLGITSATGRSTERHYIEAWSIDGCQLATTSVTWDDVRSSHGVVVKPNPANEFLTITTPSAMQARRIVIADLSGRIVASVDAPLLEHTVDVSTLPSGVYVVRIEGAERSLALPLSIVR